MTRPLLMLAVLVGGLAGLCHAEKAQIVGTVTDARTGIAVSVHPVMVAQGRETLARTLTDRLGKFNLEFTPKTDEPLTLRTGSTTGYLEAHGAVEPNTEVAVQVMPRWATILGIVTDRRTGRGLPDIPVRAARGERPVPETWASTKTDAAGVFMLKVPAFDGDDLDSPVRDLWLSVNEDDEANTALAVVRTDTLPLVCWPDATQATRVEVSLPPADATGLTIADVVAIKAPDAMRPAEAPEEPTAPTAVEAPEAPTPPPVVEAPRDPAATTVELRPGEAMIVCPHCGERFKVILVPVQ